MGSHNKSRKDPGYSATGPKVYAARFRRAKRLQLERQVMFEILDGGRIHRQVRRKLLDVLLSGNDQSSLNPSQRSDTWRMVKSDGGEAELTSDEK
jgi:xanthine/CO dehydrogenase XdhC/CoxF family maturation factor